MAKRIECYFPSSNGEVTVHVVKWLPQNGDYKAVLQIAHGMNEYIERYDEFASFIADNGYMVVGNDHVGHGDSVTDNNYGYFGKVKDPSDILVEDMHILRTKMQTQDKPYFILGHSMGSYMLRKYLSKYGEGLAGGIIMGTGYIPKTQTTAAIAVTKMFTIIFGSKHRSPFIRNLTYGKPYKKFSLNRSELSEAVYSNSWLTRDEEIVKRYYNDPRSTFVFTTNAYLGLFSAVKFSCNEKNAKTISKDLPIMLISGENDPVGNLGKAVEKVYNMYKDVGIKDITCKLYPDMRHEVLNEIGRSDVYTYILSWLEEKCN